MTKKDFILISATLKTRREMILHDRSMEVGNRAVAVMAIDGVAREFAFNLAVVNERFDRAKFLKACGVAS